MEQDIAVLETRVPANIAGLAPLRNLLGAMFGLHGIPGESIAHCLSIFMAFGNHPKYFETAAATLAELRARGYRMQYFSVSEGRQECLLDGASSPTVYASGDTERVLVRVYFQRTVIEALAQICNADPALSVSVQSAAEHPEIVRTLDEKRRSLRLD